MSERFIRSEILLGREAMEKLRSSTVAVFGIGGVGGYVVEGLARCGVGSLVLTDHDTVSLSNINRQIVALESTVGQYKADVAAQRVSLINPDCRVIAKRIFFLPETRDQFDFSAYDYVVDAIDTVAGKLALIEEARRAGVPVISSMGAGNKLDAAAFRVADIYQTNGCPLARVMRRECRKRGIDRLKVVYSEEKPLVPMWELADEPENGAQMAGAQMNGGDRVTEEMERQEMEARRRRVPGSVSFVPSVAGLIIAGEVIRDLTGRDA